MGSFKNDIIHTIVFQWPLELKMFILKVRFIIINKKIVYLLIFLSFELFLNKNKKKRLSLNNLVSEVEFYRLCR